VTPWLVAAVIAGYELARGTAVLARTIWRERQLTRQVAAEEHAKTLALLSRTPAAWTNGNYPDSDPETWTKVAGNYGPVTVVEWGEHCWYDDQYGPTS
jgi:hypothetical protein